MTRSTSETVISGVPYRVTEVNGRSAGEAVEPDELVGTTTFVVEGQTGRHTITGEGATLTDGVHVYEKDLSNDGKDVRVWRVYHAPGTGLVAETV